MKDFQSNPAWKPSLKIYYGKYSSCIKFGPFDSKAASTWGLLGIEDYLHHRKDSIDFRIGRTRSRNYKTHMMRDIVKRYDLDNDYSQYDSYEEAITKFYCFLYTNDEGLLDYASNSLEVIEFRTPINEQHTDVLENLNVHEEFRETKFFDKFTYRIDSWPTLGIRGTRKRALSDNDKRKAYEWVMECFAGDDHHLRQRSSWMRHPFNYQQYHSRKNTIGIGQVQHTSAPTLIPFIYTNDESKLFLFKMAYAGSYSIIVTKIITPNSLDIIV